MTTPLQCVGIVLAAGKGTRMKSALPKVLHDVLGKPMLVRVLENLDGLGLEKLIIITGHGAEAVETLVKGLHWKTPITFVHQATQGGTGHALQQVLTVLPDSTDTQVLITCGDMPLVSAERYQSLLFALSPDQAATVVTVKMPVPTGYGRVIWDAQQQFEKIVEEKDASDEEKMVQWVNTGVYTAHWPSLVAALKKLTPNNAQNELYLTDCFASLKQAHQKVSVMCWEDITGKKAADEVIGINDRLQLAEANALLSKWTLNQLMRDGVTVLQPETSLVAPEVQIGADSVLHPGCVLLGAVHIGERCQIGPHVTMRKNIRIGEACTVFHSVLERGVTVGNHNLIGPFAHLRDSVTIANQTKVGNFVEMKQATFGERSQAAHLAYIGDVDIGQDVNMGAGSIIANYDPIRDRKHRSQLGDGVKVGCNSVLVSPITIGVNACVAAGSVITADVPPEALVLTRATRVEKPDWVKNIREQAISP